MNDLISRSALLEKATVLWNEAGEYEICVTTEDIETAPTIEQPTWISCEDKLPEYKQDVLMYFDTGNMAAAF